MDKLILDSIFIYYPKLKVLQGAFLEVCKSEITCLVGRNGSGKSTLFKIASGQLKADSGITQLGKIRIHKKSASTRFKYIGYLPQKSFLPKSIKVSEVIDKKIAEQDRVLLKAFNSKVKELSFGERRYLEILFVLFLSRDFILLDEPFTGLSPIMIEKVIDHIQTAKENGAGILISDHYMHYVSKIGDTFYLLQNGQISKLE